MTRFTLRSLAVAALVVLGLPAGSRALAAVEDPITRLVVEVQTGEDDKRSGGTVWFQLGSVDAFVFSPHGETLNAYTRKKMTHTLRSPMPRSSFGRFGLRFVAEVWPGGIDSWSITGVRVMGYDAAGRSYELFDDFAIRSEPGGWVSTSSSRPRRTNKAEMAIYVGADDLREWTNDAAIVLIDVDGREYRGFLGRAPSNSVAYRSFDYDGSRPLHRIEIISHELTRRGVFDELDGWDISQIHLTVPRGDTRVETFGLTRVGTLRSGEVWQSRTINAVRPVLPRSCTPAATILTSNDDLKGDSQAVVGIELEGGEVLTSQPLSGLRDRTLGSTQFSREVDPSRIRSVFIRFDRGNNDGWNIKRLTLSCAGAPSTRLYTNNTVNARLEPGGRWVSERIGR